jgi:hypothetical protein
MEQHVRQLRFALLYFARSGQFRPPRAARPRVPCPSLRVSSSCECSFKRFLDKRALPFPPHLANPRLPSPHGRRPGRARAGVSEGSEPGPAWRGERERVELGVRVRIRRNIHIRMFRPYAPAPAWRGDGDASASPGSHSQTDPDACAGCMRARHGSAGGCLQGHGPAWMHAPAAVSTASSTPLQYAGPARRGGDVLGMFRPNTSEAFWALGRHCPAGVGRTAEHLAAAPPRGLAEHAQ